MHRAALALRDALDPGADPALPPHRLSVCLITAFNLADLLDPELTADTARTTTGAQLGILTLAAILRNRGHPVHIVELDGLFLELLDLRKGRRDGQRSLAGEPLALLPGGGDAPLIPNLFELAVQRLSKVSADVFGFSSICSSYPLTLRLAQAVKRLNPGQWVVLGGPQASVVDVPTLSAFAAMDFILRGEADQTFPALIDALGRGHGWDQIAGLTFRSGGQVKRNPSAPVVLDLDHLPMPAFDLDADLKDRGSVHLEIGRGCPFACTFCSTNDFFRRNFRLKSAERVIQEMDHLRRDYGTTYFSLVHDMYTVDRRKVAAFCGALLAHRAGHTWGCSARTDCIDDELIGLMAQAGCRGIFFGIETGSRRLQKVIRKNLDLDEAVERIACADRHEIKTAVALIIGFPDETREDLRDTIHFFIDALRFDHAEPQLSLLAPLAATPLHEEHRHELMFDRIYSDISCQSWEQDPVEEEMIRAHPEIFPNFYAIPTVHLERRYLSEVRDFVSYVSAWFRWLPVALLQDSGDLLRVFDRWRAWLLQMRGQGAADPVAGAPYHCRRQFRRDFLDFVRSCYLQEMARSPGAVAALVQVEGVSQADLSADRPNPGVMQSFSAASVREKRGLAPLCEGPEGPSGNGACPLFSGPLSAASVPALVGGAALMDLSVDYKVLIDTLRSQGDLAGVPERRVTVLVRRAANRGLDTWQLAPLSATLLRLCDGRRNVTAVVQAFSGVGESILNVSPAQACWFGLGQLRDQGFISFSAIPLPTTITDQPLVQVPLPAALRVRTSQQP
jgi:radical SAM superfamily enzyme YgiQ (UPF0313 family)